VTVHASQHTGIGPELSIVVPVYNEAANIDAFFARLDPLLETLGLSCEIVLIDDGSADNSWDILHQRSVTDARLRLVRLSRNFGKDIALTAGLRHARGHAVIPIDADLQHPPELIAEFVAKWRDGYDMVYGVRQSRATDSKLRRLASGAFYRLFDRLTDTRMPRGAGDFRLLDRRVVDTLNDMPERARFMKGLFAWVGFRQIGVPFEPGERHGGFSAWSLRRLFGFAIDGIASFSRVPLVMATYLGVALAVPSLLLGLFFIARTLIWGVDVPGYASVIVAVLLLGGIQLLTLGLFGSYLGRVFDEVKGRPLFIVSDRAGFDEAAISPPADDRRLSGPDAARRSFSPSVAGGRPGAPAPRRAAGVDP
jgi:polyisoprenyl-phosphate glycosyltransferase